MRNKKTVIVYTKNVYEGDPSWLRMLKQKFALLGYNCVIVPSDLVDTIEVF